MDTSTTISPPQLPPPPSPDQADRWRMILNVYLFVFLTISIMILIFLLALLVYKFLQQRNRRQRDFPAGASDAEGGRDSFALMSPVPSTSTGTQDRMTTVNEEEAPPDYTSVLINRPPPFFLSKVRKAPRPSTSKAQVQFY